jgi:hypothetical protein
METIEQLEHIIEELGRKVNATLEKTTQLQRASEKALDTAMHVYKLDDYGYLWAYEAETQTYRKTKMRVATPEIINEAIKAKHIAEGAIIGDKVEAGAVVPGKIADDAVQTRNIKDGSVTFDKLDEATKNIVITGGGQHGIPLSPEFGDSNVLGISQKALTESRDNIQSQINAIVNDKAQVELPTSPTCIFVGVESSIELAATTDTEATNIKITKGSAEIASGSGFSLSGHDTVTPEGAGDISYQAEFLIAGLLKNASKVVAAVYPIKYGAGQSYSDAGEVPTPRTSPAGTYQVAVANDGDYVFFVVPSTMTIAGAKMSGFDFPLQAPVDVEIDGVAYKYYQSANTYDAGTLTIVIS